MTPRLRVRAIAAAAALAASAWLAAGGGPVVRAAPAAPASRPGGALILFDGTSLHHLDGGIDAVHVANLLGHFGIASRQEPVESYQPGEIARADFVFVVIGNENAPPVPAALLRDAHAATKPLVWIGYALETFLTAEERDRRGLSVDGYLRDSAYRSVMYRGTRLGKGTGDLARITIGDPARVAVAAVAVDPAGHELPYIVHAGNVWAVGDVPFAYLDEEDRYLAFCDVLHDMVGVPHATDHRALIRLEDINPEDDPSEVRRAVGAFVAEGVPFQIALVPIYRDPASSREVTLSDRPDLVAAVHDAVAAGGTIVLHGATHQYHGTTPDDFEFWDSERNRPRPDDSAALVGDKIASALDECFRNDLYPVAWETPHYTASLLDYAEFARVFSTINDRPLTIEVQGTQQFVPYPVTDVRGTLVVPEDLGYLPSEKPDPAALVSHAQKLLAVRDSIASAYVHDFLDPRQIRAVIQGVKALGYRYISLRDFPARVTARGRLVLTAGAHGALTLDDEYLHEFVLTRDGRRDREQYSADRRTGEIVPTLTPAPGDVVVATGTTDLPTRAVPPPAGLSAFAARLMSGLHQHSPVAPAAARPLKAALVWDPAFSGPDATDQTALRNAFSAYGVPPRPVSHDVLTSAVPGGDEVLIVPAPSARRLSRDEIAAVARAVSSGGGAILDGRSPLAEALGIVYTGATAQAAAITDRLAPEVPIRWRPAAAVDAVRLPTGATVLDSDPGTGAIVAASFAAGAGRVLYLADLFDPYSADGTSRYPFVFEHALQTFGRDLAARRPTVELYFDPGLRPGVNIEELAPMWRRLGVRAIYAAAWEFDSTYTYDYERLLRVAHANGLLVYAWFEFPQVSRLFWTTHPEWREQAAAGDTLPSWRLLMNFSNDACRAAVIQFMLDVAGRWPWDGVNLAELNFDGVSDGDDAERSLPMNADVRRDFEAAHGFDPDDLFDERSPHWWKQDTRGWAAWIAYRQQLVTSWHREFLSALRPMFETGREVVVTLLDGLDYPQVSLDGGVDVPAIVGLMREFPFTLQVEDPAAAWTGTPHRYEALAAAYRPLVPDARRLMFDINVVADRRVDATHLASALTTGTELAAAVRAARTASGRIAIYGDATARARDLELLAAASADDARIASTGALSWTIDTPTPVEVMVPGSLRDFYLENALWPYWRPGYVLVPAGHHVLSAYRPWFRLLEVEGLRPHVLQMTGSIGSASVSGGELRVAYDAPARVVAVLDREPEDIRIDGAPGAPPTIVDERTFVLVLPAGRHEVAMAGSTRGALVLDFISIISSSLIVAFGTTACILLAGFYLGVRVRRAVRRRSR